MARPKCNPNLLQETFTLLDIVTTTTCDYRQFLIAFAYTDHGASVAFQIQKFRPYLYCDDPMDAAFCRKLKDALQPVGKNISGPDLIVEKVEKCQLVYFTDNKKVPLLKISCPDDAVRQRIAKHLATTRYSNPLRLLGVYHSNNKLFPPHAQFLQSTGLRLQGGFTVSKHKPSDDLDKIGRVVKTVHVSDLVATNHTVTHKVLALTVVVRVVGGKITSISSCSYFVGEPTIRTKLHLTDNNEKQLLLTFCKTVLAVDPDYLITYSEAGDTLQILTEKCSSLKVNNSNLSVVKPRKSESAFSSPHQFHIGRIHLDLKHIVAQMPLYPKLRLYDLQSVAEHLKLLTDLRDPLAEANLLVDIESGFRCILSDLQLSHVTNCSLNQLANGGQQVKIWSKLSAEISSHNYFVDTNQLSVPWLETSLPEGEISTYPVEQWERKGHTTRTLLGHTVHVPDKPLKAKKYVGGAVMEPHIGLYIQPGESVMTFDYSSHYPTIISEYGICYSALLPDTEFGRKILADKSYVKRYLSIGTDQSRFVVSVTGKVVDGHAQKVQLLLPDVMQKVAQERTNIRKQQAEPGISEKEYNLLNLLQLSRKVFQNAMYGFLGAIGPSAYLPLPALMGETCAIGRYLLDVVRLKVLKQYPGATIVYGDTDSVMVRIPVPGQFQTPDEVYGYLYSQVPVILDNVKPSFRPGVKLTFEGLKTKFLLVKKKMYYALQHGPNTWTEEASVLRKGLPHTKLDRCLLVTRLGDAIVDSQFNNQLDEDILQTVTTKCEDLLSGRVPIEDLTISLAIGKTTTGPNSVQNVLAAKIRKRHSRHLSRVDRVLYVVIAGCQNLAERCEDPAVVIRDSLPLDLEWYIVSQLTNPLLALVQFRKTLHRKLSAVLQRFAERASALREKQTLDSFFSKKRKIQT